jgi:ATP-dependent DNA helicase PIF1
MLFTNDQQIAISAIKKGRNVMITGPGGTGKTTIINHLKDVLMDPVRYLGVTAMTGAAAVLIGGTTLHSYLGIGLGKDSEDDLVKKINGREKLKRKWRDTNILVVDEVSMLPADLFDKLNRIAKRVRRRSEPFGGMQLVFGGDFLQLPCIKGSFCFESKAWKECGFEIFHLTKIMRQADKQFQACLNRARFGEMTEEDFEYVTQSDDRRVGKPLKEKIASMEIKPTRILCENVDVNEINQTKLEQLPVEEIYKYKYKIEYNLDNYESRVHHFMFKDITKLCNAQPTLCLSVGAQVMLLVNMDVKQGLVNGSRGVVTRFIECKTCNSKGEEKIQYKPVVRFKDGEIVMNRHGYEVKDGKYLVATIFQIPLKLAYAVTVHKSQGMTLDSAIINLKGVFEYGQAYVALSRAKDVNNLFLKNVTKSAFKAHPKALEFYRQFERRQETIPENNESNKVDDDEVTL